MGLPFIGEGDAEGEEPREGVGLEVGVGEQEINTLPPDEVQQGHNTGEVVSVGQ